MVAGVGVAAVAADSDAGATDPSATAGDVVSTHRGPPTRRSVHVTSVDGFRVIPALTEAVRDMGYIRPTPIQAETIPVVLAGGI